MTDHAEPVRGSSEGNMRGSIWLLADMGLNIGALTLVKLLGADYPAFQLVFLRSLTGLLFLVPILIRQRPDLIHQPRKRLHVLRVGLSALTLTTSFYAVANLPLALFMTMNFTRPIIMLVFAAALLHEVVTRPRWIAAIFGLVGVLIAVQPSNVPWSFGLLAICTTVITGTLAIVVTRKLNDAPPLVLMTYYAAGLLVITAIPAWLTWVPVTMDHILPLLMVGVLSQVAQFCFLRAHYFAAASVLGPLGYLSLAISGVVGFVVFGEVPTLATIFGALVIVAATLFLISYERRQTAARIGGLR